MERPQDCSTWPSISPCSRLSVWFEFKLCIERIVDERPSFKSYRIIRTGEANTPADQIETWGGRLQGDILHRIGFIYHPRDALQHRVREIKLPQHRMEATVPPVMGQP